MPNLDTEITKEKQTEIKAVPNKGTRRRRFFKLVGLLAGGALLPESLERIIAQGISIGLTTPGLTDNIVSTALQLSEKSVPTENPNYRPITQILEEAISRYQKGNKNSVVFRRNSAYRDQKYYANVIEHIAAASLLPTLPSNEIQEFTEAFPADARFAYISSDARFGQFADLFSSGSGFLARVHATHPELYGSDGKIPDYTVYFSALKEVGEREIAEVNEYVEDKRAEIGEPISASHILEYFFGENNGELAQSLYDTAIFLKFMSRNDPHTGSGTSNAANETWMIQNILDEYQGPSYSSPQPNESVINLVGKPYHTWNLAAMLQFFPPELIQMSGIYRQLKTLQDQGLGKSRSDLQTLEGIHDVEKILLSYEV